MGEAGASDRATLFAGATAALAPRPVPLTPFGSMPVLLLDVPFDSEAEATISLDARQGRAEGAHHDSIGRFEDAWEAGRTGFDGRGRSGRLSTPISDTSRAICFLRSHRPSANRPASSCGFRRLAKDASVSRWRVACSRKPHVACASTRWRFSSGRRSSTLGVLEHALFRAKIPAYFDRGTRRPHPAGRAFLGVVQLCGRETFRQAICRVSLAGPGSRPRRFGSTCMAMPPTGLRRQTKCLVRHRRRGEAETSRRPIPGWVLAVRREPSPGDHRPLPKDH